MFSAREKKGSVEFLEKARLARSWRSSPEPEGILGFGCGVKVKCAGSHWLPPNKRIPDPQAAHRFES
jgi:hypothetical protein